MVTSRARSTRKGFSSGEAIAGIVVMSLAIVIVGRFAAGVTQGLAERELATRIGWQTESARAEIAAWAYGEISAENIVSKLAFDSVLLEQLNSPKWEATVEEVEQPVAAKRVQLSLKCVYDDQVATPSTLTFWVPRPTRSAASESPASDQSPTEDNDEL
ncbi:MAG: hypothetical protein Aurels2KO_41160 [Aureliella sp.]